jgi:two-component system CheB/CheR fusion protein
MSETTLQANEPKSVISAIVAVSASAASTKSLEALLTRLPLHESMALIVVLQHREALDEERFGQILSEGKREITAIEDGAPIEPGRIYLPRANVIVNVEDGRFQTRAAEQPSGGRGVIDSLFVSLARDEDGRTILVTLAGTGGDGTLGVKAVKEAGGLALAEETPETRAGDLAGSQSPAALADAVLSVAALSERIVAHVEQLARGQNAGHDARADPGAPEMSSALAAIATTLRNKTGHDFHGYKPGTFLRRVQRRMQVVQTEHIQHYVEILRARSDEAQNLFNDLLIGVTQFFRDTREFELVEREIIPKLFEGKTRNDQLRVWVVGCATGEEAYSLAILLREHMATLHEVPQIQIFATDLDGRALASARAGRYADTIAAVMSPERLARWFVREGDTYCVVKELREMCIFSQHSIIKDAPFSRLDLVSCRNLLIYLEADLQGRVIPLFHFALRPSGFLFLGNSENVARHTNLFAPIEPRSRIFRRLETGTRSLPDFPFTAVDRRFLRPPEAEDRPRPPEAVLARRAERLAERYAPAYVIVDEAYNVLHFSGRTGRYIDPAGGAASLNLLQLVHPDLRMDLRTALSRAAEEKSTVRMPNLGVGADGHRLLVELVVEPIQDAPGSSPSFFVLFKDGVAVPATGDDEASSDQDERSQRLEAELRTTRERLQATVEELESTNEELKSSNEEYQSLNEELQSANEELETSKEELQSVNEELTTVNGELAHRVQDLTRATSDLKNFLESTQIATVFLDNELRVTNFTPAVSELYHIVESDTGRPIGHIKARVAYEELQDDARRVLRTLGVVEREASVPATGARYMVRVLPYRSTDNFIAGVVVTFVDITERQRAEEARRESEERFRAIVESARDYAIFTTDPNGRIEEWLPGAAAVFGWSPEEAVGQDGAILYTPEDRAERVFQRELATARETGVAPNVRWHQRKDESRVFIEGSARALRDASGRTRSILKIGQDITERRQGEIALRESEAHAKLLLAELQHRVRNTLTVVRSIIRRSAANSETVEDYAMHVDGRIEAFARVQAIVTRDPGAGLDLEQLIAAELLAHAPQEGEQMRSVRGPKITLRAKAAEVLTLAIHELAVNAVKHGSFSIAGGRVEVAWRTEDGADGADPLLVFDWIEKGVNLDGKSPRRSGFGTELLERLLAYELGATTKLEFKQTGLQFKLTLPLTGEISMSSDQNGRTS